MSKLSTAGAALAKIRARVAAWPDVEEKLSHGSPAWFVGKRQMAALGDNHHGDGRLALWCAAPEGAQAMLVESEPEHYFVPAYVGHLGWVGVRLDRGLPWSDVAGALERARDTITAKTAKKARSRAPTAPIPSRTKEARSARAKAPTMAPPASVRSKAR
jgi:hypothetical protein